MKQPKSPFFRHPRSLDLLAAGGMILVIALMMASLSACADPRGQAGAPRAVNHQPGATASSTQILKQAGPDAGLYIGNNATGNDSALYRVDYQSGKVLWKYQFRLSKPIPGLGNYAPPDSLIVQQGLVFVVSRVGIVYALTASTGHLAWSYTFDSTIELVRGQMCFRRGSTLCP